MLKLSRNCILYVTICLGLLFALDDAIAQFVFPDKPSARNFYADEASLLTIVDAKAVNDIAKQLLMDEHVALIVVTLSSLSSYGAAGDDIEGYARALFDKWGIGSAERNYGMLLLVARGDRKARIELGNSWSAKHNAQSAQIMNSIIVPAFRGENYSAGIVAGVKALDAMARGLALPRRFPYELLGIGALFIGIVVSLAKDGRNGWGWKALTIFGSIVVAVFLAGLLSGRSGAFRGGFSGGKGATGSW